MAVLLRVEPPRTEAQAIVLSRHRRRSAVLGGHAAAQAGKVVEDEAGLAGEGGDLRRRVVEEGDSQESCQDAANQEEGE